MSTAHGIGASIEALGGIEPMRLTGRVAALRGLTLMVRDLPAPIGSLVEVRRHDGGRGGHGAGALGEVVGFEGAHTIVMMLGSTAGIRAGDAAVAMHAARTVGVSEAMLGRVLDGLGRPIDGRGPIRGCWPRPLDPAPIPPLQRRRVTEPLYTGVRSIDLFTTLGRGQRMGIFAGPGVGKSTLLGAIARGTSADVSVIALIGERGREVRDFVEHTLGADGLRRAVVVASTSDESPLLRVRAALTACAIAEHFRDAGLAVLLMMDSVTRFAHAQRQIGLSVGEPPATRGYTPSVFASLARLLERAGAVGGLANSCPGGPCGSITGLYSVLVEGDDMTEPVADAARGILDGHIILARSLAQRGHYPAVDVLDSVSRVADDVSDAAHVAARRQIVRMIAAYRQVEDLVQIGAYAKGSSAESDVAIRYERVIGELLRQQFDQPGEPFASARDRLVKLAIEVGAALQKAAPPARG